MLSLTERALSGTRQNTAVALATSLLMAGFAAPLQAATLFSYSEGFVVNNGNDDNELFCEDFGTTQSSCSGIYSTGDEGTGEVEQVDEIQAREHVVVAGVARARRLQPGGTGRHL